MSIKENIMKSISQQHIGVARLKLLLGADCVKNMCHVILQGMKTTPLKVVGHDRFNFQVKVYVTHAGSTDMQFLSPLINSELKSVLTLHGITSLTVECSEIEKPTILYYLTWAYNFVRLRVLKRHSLTKLDITFQWQEFPLTRCHHRL